LKEVLIVVVVVVVVGGKILAMSKFIGADFDDHAKTRGATVKRSWQGDSARKRDLEYHWKKFWL
jgi:hypothetical protein